MTAAESHPAPQKSLSDCDEYRESNLVALYSFLLINNLFGLNLFIVTVLSTPVEGFSGFKTASGSSLKAPSAEARKRAKRLLEEVANSDIQGIYHHFALFSFS